MPACVGEVWKLSVDGLLAHCTEVSSLVIARFSWYHFSFLLSTTLVRRGGRKAGDPDDFDCLAHPLFWCWQAIFGTSKPAMRRGDCTLLHLQSAETEGKTHNLGNRTHAASTQIPSIEFHGSMDACSHIDSRAHEDPALCGRSAIGVGEGTLASSAAAEAYCRSARNLSAS